MHTSYSIAKLEQNIKVQRAFWLTQSEKGLIVDHSQAIFEKMIDVEGSCAINEDDFNFPEIVELNINDDKMTDNYHATFPNVLRPIAMIVYHR